MYHNIRSEIYFQIENIIPTLIYCQKFTYIFLTIDLLKKIYLHLKIRFCHPRPFKLRYATSVELC